MADGSGIHEYVCPFCELQIIANDHALTFSHEIPVCPQWEATAKEFGGVDAGVSIWIGTTYGNG